MNFYYKSRATLPVSVKHRNDYADYDYLDKLNPEQLSWLKGFNREFVNADFNHAFVKHFTDKKIAYDLNNSRNRCLYNLAKYSNELQFITVLEKTENSKWNNMSFNPENALINLIDYKIKKLKK